MLITNISRIYGYPENYCSIILIYYMFCHII
jgi:hypothetical protein